ncbi:MAG: heavy metal-binding domain-containing protein [Armatimonadota bacterium]|jgi:hypothetical protein
MKRWMVPIVAVLAFAAVALIIAGCQTEQADTATTVMHAPEAHHQGAGEHTEHHEAAHDVEGEFTYTCPMHPEVTQDRPGRCPECGMFLVADTDADVEYYCPMHPEVVEDAPGRCPECGMFLEARSVEDTE